MAKKSDDDVIDITPELSWPEEDNEPRAGARSARIMLLSSIVIFIAVIGILFYAWQYWEGASQELAALNSQVEETRARQQQLKAAMTETTKEIEHQKAHIRSQQQRLREQQREIESERARVESLNVSVDESTSRFRSGEQRLKERVAEAEERLAGSPDRWIGAEARHLLKIAQQKLHYREDIDDAVEAMQEALETLDKGDESFASTRMALADEIAALKGVVIPDSDTIEEQLLRLNRTVRNLSLRKVVYENSSEYSSETGSSSVAEASPDETTVPEWRRIAESGMRRLRSLVEVRHHREGHHPGITSLHEELVRQHLRLTLDNARIALQREENDMYQGALLLAKELFETYFDDATDKARRFNAEIASLREHRLSPPIPQTGEALEQLNRLLEGERR